jgi:hypothetical protein
VDDPANPLAQVAKAAIDHHCTLLVAFSDLESARYLELLKAYENKSADTLKARIEAEQSARCGLQMHEEQLRLTYRCIEGIAWPAILSITKLIMG